MIKKHHLHLQPSDCLRAEVDPDSTPSGFLISAKVLRDWLDHFTIAFGSGTGTNVRGDSHLAWLFSVNEVRVKNFETATTSTLSTEIKIDVNEFQHYEVYADRVDLALPMREFKVGQSPTPSDTRRHFSWQSSLTWIWTLRSPRLVSR